MTLGTRVFVAALALVLLIQTVQAQRPPGARFSGRRKKIPDKAGWDPTPCRADKAR
jgi:hypothetical protein